MSGKTSTNRDRQKLVVYVLLIFATLVVFWQVHQFDFINYDDGVYVTGNDYVRSGLTLKGIRWAISTRYAEFWHPLTWLSLMFDYQFYGLNAGGYHTTNLFFHILSTLLLFWLFNRMTKEIWSSAFVAAFFAVHPLHVQSVAWISQRKDVLSAFFWIVTLCFYVYYTERPAIKKYLFTFFAFILALMSKPMVVTLPFIMILLDYWPLRRLKSKPGNWIWWQLREKTPFFILSAVVSIITIYAQHNAPYKRFEKQIFFDDRITHAPIFFINYLQKIFWPHCLEIVYPSLNDISLWQVLSAIWIILAVSILTIIMVKRFPYLFCGWLWYVIVLFPVIGIIPSGPCSMGDHYTYLPSIGIAVMISWGVPSWIKSKIMRQKILFPTIITALIALSLLAWQQCGYWKNSIKLWDHSLQVSNENYYAHHYIALALLKEEKIDEAIYHYTECIRIYPDYIFAFMGRGLTYMMRNQHINAVEDYNKAIRLKQDYVKAYFARGTTYFMLGQNQQAIKDLSEAILLKPDFADAYNNRAVAYFKQGRKELGCRDAQKLCYSGYCQLLDEAKRKKLCP